jgi:hypothetical protein
MPDTQRFGTLLLSFAIPLKTKILSRNIFFEKKKIFDIQHSRNCVVLGFDPVPSVCTFNAGSCNTAKPLYPQEESAKILRMSVNTQRRTQRHISADLDFEEMFFFFSF